MLDLVVHHKAPEDACMGQNAVVLPLALEHIHHAWTNEDKIIQLAAVGALETLWDQLCVKGATGQIDNFKASLHFNEAVDLIDVLRCN